jgi:hypothetical protein
MIGSTAGKSNVKITVPFAYAAGATGILANRFLIAVPGRLASFRPTTTFTAAEYKYIAAHTNKMILRIRTYVANDAMGMSCPVAKPSLLLILACAPRRDERGNVARDRLYFVGYVTTHPTGPGS